MKEQRIKKLRQEFEYTQEFVAGYLGCNRSTYANWEAGVIILPLEIAGKLSILYNVPLSYILDLGTFRFIGESIRTIDYMCMINKLNNLKITNKNSYRDISKYINTNKSTVNRYFNCKVKIPTDKLILLCEFYNVDIDDLCGIK